MTYLTFSFDTEDYVNPHAADGILYSAELLRKYNVRGCFNVVGWVAKALTEWGRQDIIDALQYHEIETHSLRHSHHPTINEYTDLEDFDAAKALFLEQEREALELIRTHIGAKEIVAACPPGTSTSYVAHYGYAELGFSFYDGDELFDDNRGRPVTNCNIGALPYTYCLEGALHTRSKEELLSDLDRLAKKDYAVIYHHPQKLIVDKFCDEMNFKGENTPREEWRLAAPHSDEVTAMMKEKYEFLLQAILADPRFQIVTYEDLEKIYPQKDTRVLSRADLPEIKAQIDEKLFPVTTPNSFCLADLLLACRDLLQGKDTHTCGFVYGFLDTPYAITAAVTLSAEAITAAADQIKDGTFLPTQIAVGDTVIGPADWLRGALAVLCGASEVTLTPAPWQIDLDQFPTYKRICYRGNWVHSPDFEDRYLSHRFRLQSWTIRLPKGTQRMIF